MSHVDMQGRIAKYRLDPARRVRAGKLSAKELSEAEHIVRDHQQQLLEARHDFFKR